MTRHVPARNILRIKQSGKCCYCETPMVRKHGERPPANAETLEHLRRRSDGGKSNYDNLALACYSCNVGRGATDWLTYKSLKMGELECAA